MRCPDCTQRWAKCACVVEVKKVTSPGFEAIVAQREKEAQRGL